MADALRFVPGYDHYIFRAGREPAFFMLLAFLVTFATVTSHSPSRSCASQRSPLAMNMQRLPAIGSAVDATGSHVKGS